MSRAAGQISQTGQSGRASRAAARARPAFIAGARGCFERAGYVGTRIDDIADAAGYAVGSFYTYFTSKEDVLLAVIEASASIEGADRDAPDLGSCVEHVGRGCAARLALDLAIEQASLRSPVVLTEWHRYREEAVSSLTGTLRRLEQSSSLSDEELASVAATLRSTVEQTSRLASLGHDAGTRSMAALWSASLGAGAVEATPLTGSVDRAAPAAPQTTASGSKARLVAAARTLFSTTPWEGVSVARIASEAGLANGTFYRHFGTKTEVLAAVIESAETELFPPASRGQSLSFPDEMFHLIVTHMDGVNRSSGLWATVTEAAAGEPSISAAIDRARRGWLVSVRDVALAWQRGGEVADSVDLASFIPLLAAMLEREAFVSGVLTYSPEGLYSSAATVRDCWWRTLTGA